MVHKLTGGCLTVRCYDLGGLRYWTGSIKRKTTEKFCSHHSKSPGPPDISSFSADSALWWSCRCWGWSVSSEWLGARRFYRSLLWSLTWFGQESSRNSSVGPSSSTMQSYSPPDLLNLKSHCHTIIEVVFDKHERFLDLWFELFIHYHAIRLAVLRHWHIFVSGCTTSVSHLK